MEKYYLVIFYRKGGKIKKTLESGVRASLRGYALLAVKSTQDAIVFDASTG